MGLKYILSENSCYKIQYIPPAPSPPDKEGYISTQKDMVVLFG